jgi:hypothetical protein
VRKLIEGIDNHLDPHDHDSRCAVGPRAARMPHEHRYEFGLGVGYDCSCGLGDFLAFVEDVRAGLEAE